MSGSSALVRDWIAPFGGALAVHVAVAILASSTLVVPVRQAEVEPTVIDAVLIDARALEAEARRLRERHEAEQRAAQEAVAAQAAAKAREIERELAAAAAIAEREASARRARELEQSKARAAEEKRAREAKAQQARETELKQQLAAEERRAKALRSGALAQYKVAVQQKVVRNWIKPAALPGNLECIVSVEQLPTGDVVKATVTRCNGDEAVKRSIESAVLRASPLPLPSDRALWERQLEFVFKPGATP